MLNIKIIISIPTVIFFEEPKIKNQTKGQKASTKDLYSNHLGGKM